MSDLISVRSTLDNNRVALWERNEAHPTGEAFIAGDKPVRVALTPAVQRKLASGELVRVDERGYLWTGKGERSSKEKTPRPTPADASDDATDALIGDPEKQLETETGHDVVQTGKNPPTFVETEKPVSPAKQDAPSSFARGQDKDKGKDDRAQRAPRGGPQSGSSGRKP